MADPNCQLCKYKEKFRELVMSYVTKHLHEEEVQTICSVLDVPIAKPKGWTAVREEAVCTRPAAFRSLDDRERGVIEKWSQRPNKFQWILTSLLDRVDLAKKHQKLLERFPAVKEYLYRLQSNPNSPTTDTEKCPIQESEEAAISQSPVLVRDASPFKTPIQETQNDESQEESHDPMATIHEDPLGFGGRTFSTVSRESIASSGFGEQSFSIRTMSNASARSRFSSVSSVRSRLDSGISDCGTRNVSLPSNTVVCPTGSFPLKVNTSLVDCFESNVETFCLKCRDWISRISPHGSPLPSRPARASASNTLESSDEHYSTAELEDGSSSDSMTNSLDLHITSTSNATKVSESLTVEREKLLNSIKPDKRHLPESILLPTLKVSNGCRGFVKLQPVLIPEVSGFKLCINVIPNTKSIKRRSVQVPSMDITASVYASNEKECHCGHAQLKKGVSSDLNIANYKQSTTVQPACSKEAAEITQFPNLITSDQLTRADRKYIIIEVLVIVTDDE